MTRRLPIALLLVATLLAACRSSDSNTFAEVRDGLDQPPQAMGRIFFYRQQVAFLVGIEPDVIVNDKRVGTARFGEVFYRDAKPGRYRVYSTHDPDNIIEFTVGPGDTLYVKTGPDFRITGFRLTAQQIPPERARGEIRDLALVSGL